MRLEIAISNTKCKLLWNMRTEYEEVKFAWCKFVKRKLIFLGFNRDQLVTLAHGDLKKSKKLSGMQVNWVISLTCYRPVQCSCSSQIVPAVWKKNKQVWVSLILVLLCSWVCTTPQKSPFSLIIFDFSIFIFSLHLVLSARYPQSRTLVILYSWRTVMMDTILWCILYCSSFRNIALTASN